MVPDVVSSSLIFRPTFRENISVTISLPNLEQLLNAINPEHLIGKGFCFSVYSIDGYPNLVFRHFGHLEEVYIKNIQDSPIIPIKEERIDTNINYGQAVAHVGDRDTVNFRVPGEVLAHINSSDELSNYKHKLFALASLPQESYDQLCNDALYLKRKRLGIDAVVTNVFLDEKQQKFYFVDVEPISPDNFQKMDNGVSGMAVVCTLSQKNNLIRDLSPLEKQRAKTATRTILSKVLKAAQKTGLGFSDTNASEENIGYIAETMDYLQFSSEDKKRTLHDLLTKSFYRNQILGHLNLKNER